MFRDIPWFIWLFISVIFLFIGFTVHFSIKYKCVSGHYENQMQTQCYTTNNYTNCTSYPYKAWICDEYVEMD